MSNTMNDTIRAYVAVAADFGDAIRSETPEGAEAAALAFGEGAHVIDTLGAPYHPAVQQVVSGELMLVGFGSFNPKRGADANLLEAAKKKQPYAMRAFLEVGANPGVTEKDGATALHWAVGRGCVDCAKVLLAAGGDADAADAKGVSPRALAQKSAKADMVALFS